MIVFSESLDTHPNSDSKNKNYATNPAPNPTSMLFPRESAQETC